MTSDIEKIKRLIVSKDKDSIYLGCSIIRECDFLDNITKAILLKDVDVFYRIRNYSDICKELNIEELTIEHFKFLPLEQQRRQLAYHKLCNISKVFNGNWIPDFKNSSQYKYFPYFTKNKNGSWSVISSSAAYYFGYSLLGFGLYFKDEKTALHVVNLFLEIYLDYLPD